MLIKQFCICVIEIYAICMCQQIYSREELTMISDLCKSHDVVCVSDEVYEWMTFDGNQHIKIGEL